MRNELIRVTGGASYIGSHTVVELLEAGHQVVILGNFPISNVKAIRRIKQITGHCVNFVQGDAVKVVNRRQGDIAECYADGSSTVAVLGCRASKGIDETCTDAWHSQSINPHGYEKGPAVFDRARE